MERLFGIDADLKSEWRAIAGAYAGTKGISKGIQGGISSGKSLALRSTNGMTSISGLAHGLNEWKKRKTSIQRQPKEQVTWF
ncbi:MULTISPECIES: hypothetical protein [unclassified Bacillus (in: firmicutes)]|uniref:hypothetical protein n=1 Tax=unclassified Bacillus (in: firmicutes) TaxID=185979 RepID=UPI001BEA43E0|nr:MULTISPECIES: hypothetical protein [unclassified Bacillus (in: firmicutes)]MBT2617768.1 hypothetical protein [Bacillus sp. ISL-78]MBT2629581.1 hypothetical protein [Bacillus sp. ISL-101]